jgi:CHAD domain-containing protein
MPKASPATEFAHQQADRLLTAFGEKLERAADLAAPDSVHDLRVAIRRFSQVLTVFKPSFPGPSRRKIRKQLKKLMDLAGEVRNCDIAAALILELDSHPDPGLHRRIHRRRRHAEQNLSKRVERLNDGRLLVKWREGLRIKSTAPQDGSSNAEVIQTVQPVVEEMASDFSQFGNVAAKQTTSASEVHRFRITCKKFRYTLEVVEPFYGSRLAPWIQRVKSLQSVLGNVNDCETVLHMISEWGAGKRLIAKLERRQNRELKEFRTIWAETRDAGEFPNVVPAKPPSRAISMARAPAAVSRRRVSA